MSTPEDPRLQPTPDYGSLGPGSGTQSSSGPLKPQAARCRPLAAIATGALLAVPFVATRSVRAAWEQFAKFLSLQGKPAAEHTRRPAPAADPRLRIARPGKRHPILFRSPEATGYALAPACGDRHRSSSGRAVCRDSKCAGSLGADR